MNEMYIVAAVRFTLVSIDVISNNINDPKFFHASQELLNKLYEFQVSLI